MTLRILKKNMNSIYFSEIVCPREEVIFSIILFPQLSTCNTCAFKKIRRKIRIKIFWLAKWEKFAFPIFFCE